MDFNPLNAMNNNRNNTSSQTIEFDWLLAFKGLKSLLISIYIKSGIHVTWQTLDATSGIPKLLRPLNSSLSAYLLTAVLQKRSYIVSMTFLMVGT